MTNGSHSSATPLPSRVQLRLSKYPNRHLYHRHFRQPLMMRLDTTSDTNPKIPSESGVQTLTVYPPHTTSQHSTICVPRCRSEESIALPFKSLTSIFYKRRSGRKSKMFVVNTSDQHASLPPHRASKRQPTGNQGALC
jgi:hypothetical protein